MRVVSLVEALGGDLAGSFLSYRRIRRFAGRCSFDLIQSRGRVSRPHVSKLRLPASHSTNPFYTPPTHHYGSRSARTQEGALVSAIWLRGKARCQLPCYLSPQPLIHLEPVDARPLEVPTDETCWYTSWTTHANTTPSIVSRQEAVRPAQRQSQGHRCPPRL